MAEEFDWTKLKQYESMFDLWFHAKSARKEPRSSKPLGELSKLATISFGISFVTLFSMLPLCFFLSEIWLTLLIPMIAAICIGVYFDGQGDIIRAREWIEENGYMEYDDAAPEETLE